MPVPVTADDARPMTSSPTSSPTLRRAVRRALLAVTLSAVVAPGLAQVATAAASDDVGTICRTVDATGLGRDDGPARVDLDGSGITLVREGARIRLEGDPGSVRSLTVTDDQGAPATFAGPEGELYLAGYAQVEVCWQPATPVVPSGTAGVAVPAVEGGTTPPIPADGDPLPEPAVTTGPTEPTGVTATTRMEPSATADRAAATVPVDGTRAGNPAVPAATVPQAPARAAVADAAVAGPRLAVTGVPVGPVAALSGGSVLLGAALVVLRDRAARPRATR